MFIHLGNDNVIQTENIIAIVEKEITAYSGEMEEMMAGAEKRSLLTGPEADAKSIVITTDGIYYSTLSVYTLKKRAKMTSSISKMEDYSDEINIE